jgi:hypothetical protein
MSAVRIEITVPEATYEQIEQARGLVPRAAWIKALIERELESAALPRTLPDRKDDA